jgi:hypothetical protein
MRSIAPRTISIVVFGSLKYEFRRRVVRAMTAKYSISPAIAKAQPAMNP